MVLEEIGDLIHIVCELDDLGTQGGPLISPDYASPADQAAAAAIVLSFIKKRAPHAKIFYHSCGSVYHFIGDLIEAGVSIPQSRAGSGSRYGLKAAKERIWQ